MFSRTDIPITPSHWVGAIASLPWLCLGVFTLILALSFGSAFLLLLAASVGGAVYQWNLNGRLGLAKSITRLIVTESGIVAERRDGQQLTVTVEPESRLYFRLMILKLRPTNSNYNPITVLLWSMTSGAGNISTDLHRRLRVWLNLGPQSSDHHQIE
ncbi:hypothetical protein [Marinobacter sp. CHS3-4]|uniref:hypothetical protein n=1 Tax=Marinobacter sp. CHS3-4 TaxID=3045174 RepID=UPI0024B5D013|nr:hypothetical protein [Marinobacter sp. CHS3-4]MDI9246131.1 hypothetical protein [Marinobacter sp. CHS3-4]